MGLSLFISASAVTMCIFVYIGMLVALVVRYIPLDLRTRGASIILVSFYFAARINEG